MTEKIFEGFLILDWNNKKVRVVMKKPKKVKPFEIPIHFKIKVKVPQIKEVELKGEIEIPERKVSEMVLETL
mgnify:CR=1 FL=1